MGKAEEEDRFQQFNPLTSAIIGAAMRVHDELGPGIFESVYHKCMVAELEAQQMTVCSELPVQIVYRGRRIDDDAFKIDLLADDTVILELKSVETVLPRHKKQLLTYLRLTSKPLGLLINFNVELLKNGIYRIIDPRWEPDQG